MSESFQERVARLKREAEERKGLLAAVPEPEPVRALSVVPDPAPAVKHDDDLIPDVEPGYDRTEADDEIDNLVDSIDILEAYRRWCGKMTPNPRGKRESVMISCPKPEHPDRTPSAWLNLDKETWFCGSCQEGGDKFDIAAMHYGFPIPGYKDGKNFPDLRRRIAEDLGYVIKRSLGGTEYLERVEVEPEAPSLPAETIEPAEHSAPDISDTEPKHSVVEAESEPEEAESAVVESGPTSTVLAFPSLDDLDDEDILEYPTVDWYSITPPDSFLRRWMEATRHDDLPEEFYFWLGMQALGLAAGRDTTLADAPPIYGNLYICLFGKSGQGKSRAQRALTDMLREALPYDHDDPTSSGTYIVPTPGSAEALIDAFSKPIYDPTDPKKLMGYGSVRGFVRFDELSSLTARGARSGSVMKPTLMQFFDAEYKVELKTRGSGLALAQEPFAACTTSTQPRAVRDLLTSTDADSGFLNRWIFACGRDKKKVSFGRRGIDLTDCIDSIRSVRAWCTTTPTITLTDEAFDVWDEFFHNTLEPARQDEEQPLLTRTDLHIKKIMLLLAIDRGERRVSAQTALDAISLWEYLERSYKMLGGEIGMGPLEEARQIIRTSMERYQNRYKRAISRRELRNLIAKKRVALEHYARTLKLMQEIGEIEEVLTKTSAGKTVERYRLASEE